MEVAHVGQAWATFRSSRSELMLPLRPTAGNWIKFLLLLALLLLVTIVVQGDRSAKDQTQINNLEKEKKEWVERDKNQDTRLKKLEQSVKKLKTSKVNSPKKTPTAQVAYVPVDKRTIANEIRQVFPRNDEIMVAVCMSESGLRTDAVSPTGDYGVCQINLATHWAKVPGNNKEQKEIALKNYKTNIQLALVISSNGYNFNPWTDYRNGKYLRYLYVV